MYIYFYIYCTIQYFRQKTCVLRCSACCAQNAKTHSCGKNGWKAKWSKFHNSALQTTFFCCSLKNLFDMWAAAWSNMTNARAFAVRPSWILLILSSFQGDKFL